MPSKTLGLGAIAAVLAIALAPAAKAATTIPLGSSKFFITNGTLTTPSMTALFFDSFSSPTTFDDVFTFTIPQNGLGSSSLSTSFSSNANKLTITSLTINGTPYGLNSNGAGQSVTVNGLPILDGVLNKIEVQGYTLTTGNFDGTATFTAVPEPATWGMMIVGLGLAGMGLRRRRASLGFA